MPKVFIEGQDGETKAKIAFDLNRLEVKIGRGENNDLIIESDSSISTEHCIIRRVFGGYVIKDLESRNGIIVDGEKTEKAILTHEIKINVGDAPMTFTYLEDEEKLLKNEDQEPGRYATMDDLLDLEDQRYADQDEDKSIIGRPDASTTGKADTTPKLKRANPATGARSMPKAMPSQASSSNGALAFIGVVVIFVLGIFGGLFLKHQMTHGSSLLEDLDSGKTKFSL